MPWLRRTGQLWKLVVFSGGMVVPWVLAQLGVGLFPDSWFVSLAVFVWFIASVRCPRCGGHPAWYLANYVRAGEFDRRLLDAERCPICRDGQELQDLPPLFSAFRRP
jgi:hypothetical protein